ncbi:MAG: hypothetical protein MJ096_04680 [Clostridia bacterium]|nr:hypothetical protein [Clostridia bacterium]
MKETDNEKNFPKRKELRVKQYSYSSSGAYFVTICIKDRKQLLSNIIGPVGVGALDDPPSPQIHLTEIGKIIEKNLLSSEKIPGVKIDRYVIMPEHIHAIILLDSDQYVRKGDGSSRAPTPTNEMLPHVISVFKRFCNKEIGNDIFQRGYYEHIIRDKEDYETRVRYIFDNPAKRFYCVTDSEEQ